MRLRFSRHLKLRYLSLSIALLGAIGVLAGTTGVLASTTGLPLATATACGCEEVFKLGLLKASEQPVKFLGIGVLEKEHFDYETFPVGGPESEEAELETTTIEEKTLAGKIGKWEIKKNECVGKVLKPGLSCLIEVEFKGEAESMEVLEEPKQVCGRIVQPYRGVVSGKTGRAVAKLNCEM